MKLSPEDIRHVAELARLDVSETDMARYIQELGAILNYIEKLQDLPTEGVAPTASVGVEQLPLRPDEIRPGLPVEQALANAPEVRASHFRVPRVVE